MLNKLILPRGYISYSSMSLLESSEKTWIERYVYGKPSFESKYTRFGSYVDEEIQKGKSDDPMVDMVIGLAPRYKYFQYKVMAMLGDIKLLGYIDTYEPYKLDDYKTGKVKWTQSKADKSDQLLFYATEIYILKKKIPECGITWLETKDSIDGGVELTGKVQTFKVIFSMVDILKMMARIKKSAERMSEIYQLELEKL